MANQVSPVMLGDHTPFTMLAAPSPTLLRAMEIWRSNLTRGHRELADFVMRRVARDLAAITDGLVCRDWADVMTLQREWWDQTLTDYASELQKVCGLMHEGPGGRERASSAT